MAISISYDTSRDLTIFTVKGEMTFDEQMAVLKEFYEGAPSANVLWDFRGQKGSRITSNEQQDIIIFIKRHGDKRPHGKTALVASRDVDFGISRVSEVYADYEKLPWQMQAFRSMDEALQWIDGE